MTFHLHLPPQLHERLRQESERRGEAAEALALRILDEHLPPPLDARRAAALAMLQQWMEEDAQMQNSEEGEEFFRGLDAARTSDRPLFPPEMKGISW
ncbi:MAG TPA: hypothetical protein VMF69_26465 [Gemmataceae bacterium]|nr:hypothetical protein [Gemmataceae bacterium]